MEIAHQDCVCNAEQKYLMWCSSASNVGWQWKHKLLFFLSKLLNHNQNMNTKALCLSVCLAYSSTKLRADTDPKQRILRKTRKFWVQWWSGFRDSEKEESVFREKGEEGTIHLPCLMQNMELVQQASDEDTAGMHSACERENGKQGAL